MKRYKSAIIICLFIMLLLPAFVLCFSPQKQAAHAFDSVSFSQAKCLDFEGNFVPYDTEDLIYARGITLEFDVTSDYFVIVVVKNGEEISRTAAAQPADGKASYTVTANGELLIKCYASDDQGTLMSVFDEVAIKSDNAAPQEAVVSQMNEWTRHESGFLVQVLVGADNGNSGVKQAVINIDNGQGIDTYVIESPMLNHAFTVYEPTDVYITVYDYAGNYLTKLYTFDKFDSTPPTPPQFVFTPNIEVSDYTNGFARDYFVTINYGTDGQSGIKQGSMRYTLNGEQYVYQGGFYLTEQRTHTLSAYYQDNAGNTSDVVSDAISNIDRIEPFVSDIILDIDLTQELPYTLSLVCTDSDSGIDRITVVGESYTFEPQLFNKYVARFDKLDKGLLQINVYDRVGNFNASSLVVPHFGTLALEDLAIKYHSKFPLLNEAEYNEDAWQNILRLYGDLSLYFKSADTTLSDFDTLTRELDEAILGETQYRYVINSVPPGINLSIRYQIDTADFPYLKKGDEITLILEKIDKDGAELDSMLFRAINASGFDTAFANPFRMKFLYNGMDVEYAFEHGATVTMQVPTGYEERLFAIINLDTNEKLTAEVINNAVTFTFKTAGRYALVTEGAQKSFVASPPSGLKVFGKTISWGAFFGTLAGVVALAAALIALLTIRYKKPPIRKPKND